MYMKTSKKMTALALATAALAQHAQILAQTTPVWNSIPLVSDVPTSPNLLVNTVQSVGIYGDSGSTGAGEGVYIGAQGVTTVFTSSSGTSILTPLTVTGQITGNLTGNVSGNASSSTFATTAGSVDAANLTGATLAPNVTGSSLTSLGVLTGLNVVGPTNLSGTNNIDGTTTIGSVTGNTSITGTNNITGTNSITGANTITGTNSISGTNSVSGTTDVTGSTTINTGASTSLTTIGGASNQTFLNSAINTIGSSASYATVNSMGTGDAFQSSNTIGNMNAASTVTLNGGAGYVTISNNASAIGTGTGGMVTTSASSATIRASSSGTLASNGSTGTMAVGAGGGYTAYATTQNTGAMNSIGGVVDNKSYTNKISGNTFVDGNVYINGTLDYVSSNSANTTVINNGAGASILPAATTPVAAGTAIVMKGATGTQTVVDSHGKLSNVTGTATEATASLTLTNGIGNTHGLVVTESQATLSGGTHSSSLTMADNGATFSDAQSGSPVQVHGVNDGTGDFDAVNVRQFSGAIASVTAMANIPQVDQDKTYALGVGVGGFMGKAALAAGLSYRFTRNGVFKASLSSAMSSSDTETLGLGMAWSF
jgi:hypothetical protein